MLQVIAGHKKKKDRRRYKSGPKKGEWRTSSEDSLDDLAINSESWSDSEGDNPTFRPLLAKASPDQEQ